MKTIYFCLHHIGVPGICLTYEETEQDLNKGKECIYTTSMAHFSFDLIERGYDIYLCYRDKKVKIEPHMDLSGIGEPCKDLRFGHNIFKLFRAGVFNDLIGYDNKHTTEDIIIHNPVDISYLQNWYQDSIDETKEPIWTDKHLEELVSDFYLIPK